MFTSYIKNIVIRYSEEKHTQKRAVLAENPNKFPCIIIAYLWTRWND